MTRQTNAGLKKRNLAIVNRDAAFICRAFRLLSEPCCAASIFTVSFYRLWEKGQEFPGHGGVPLRGRFLFVLRPITRLGLPLERRPTPIRADLAKMFQKSSMKLSFCQKRSW